MTPDDYEAKVVEARMRLRQRFLDTHASPPADARPMGRGALNRHGMPQVPIGQTVTQKWPVLDLGHKPSVPEDRWKLAIDGACEHPLVLSFTQFLALPQTDDQSDFHCVTTWSKLDVAWRGVRFSDLAALALPHPDATHVLCHGYDGYTTNLALDEALKPDVLLVYEAEGRPLAREHGGPVRMITPQLYAWKGTKWIKRIEFLLSNHPGYWETRGYSNTALPWRDDRYS